MTHAIRREVERKIADAFLTQALAAGYAINVDNGGDAEELPEPSTNKEQILGVMFQADEDRLNVYRYVKKGDYVSLREMGWVLFVYANSGWDVVSDYTTGLKDVMTEAEKLSDHYSK